MTATKQDPPPGSTQIQSTYASPIRFLFHAPAALEAAASIRTSLRQDLTYHLCNHTLPLGATTQEPRLKPEHLPTPLLSHHKIPQRLPQKVLLLDQPRNLPMMRQISPVLQTFYTVDPVQIPIISLHATQPTHTHTTPRSRHKGKGPLTPCVPQTPFRRWAHRSCHSGTTTLPARAA